MSNIFDFENMPQIESLAKELGGVGECKRLGFICEDAQGIMGLTVAGLGYLLYVRARDIKTVAEAFAAGFQCAHEEISPDA